MKVVYWDMWLRLPNQMKGRQCLQPEVLRTFHVGRKGVHTNPSIQETYFDHRILNSDSKVKISNKDRYKNISQRVQSFNFRNLKDLANKRIEKT